MLALVASCVYTACPTNCSVCKEDKCLFCDGFGIVNSSQVTSNALFGTVFNECMAKDTKGANCFLAYTSSTNGTAAGLTGTNLERKNAGSCSTCRIGYGYSVNANGVQSKDCYKISEANCVSQMTKADNTKQCITCEGNFKPDAAGCVANTIDKCLYQTAQGCTACKGGIYGGT